MGVLAGLATFHVVTVAMDVPLLGTRKALSGLCAGAMAGILTAALSWALNGLPTSSRVAPVFQETAAIFSMGIGIGAFHIGAFATGVQRFDAYILWDCVAFGVFCGLVSFSGMMLAGWVASLLRARREG